MTAPKHAPKHEGAKPTPPQRSHHAAPPAVIVPPPPPEPPAHKPAHADLAHAARELLASAPHDVSTCAGITPAQVERYMKARVALKAALE